MLPSQHFVDYTNGIIYYNIILKGTSSHSDDAKLRDSLSHNMSEGLVNKLNTLAADEHTRINDIVGLNMWVQEVETVDHIWKTDVKNTANLMNEVMNRWNREEAWNTARQPDHRNTELPTQNKGRDENRFHPYHSHSDWAQNDRSDHDCDQDHRYKYHDNNRNDQDRRYTRTRDNNRNDHDHT